MHLRDRTVQVGLFRSLPLRCCRICCPNGTQAFLRQASVISKEQWYQRHGRFRKGVTPRPKKHAKPESKIPLNTKDLFVNDLAATLEAHRATNRANIIRKIPRGPPQYKNKDWKYLTDINGGEKAQNDTPKVTNNLENPTPEGSADSVPRADASKGRTPKVQGQDIVRRIVIEKAAKDLFDETPIFPPPQNKDSQSTSAQSHSISGQPWMGYVDSSYEAALELLSAEIRGLEAYMRLTPAEEKASEKVIFDVKSTLRRAFGPIPIRLLGSRETGLAIPISDFNFHISQRNSTGKLWAAKDHWVTSSRKREYETLRKIQGFLDRSPHFTSVRRIHANGSIVKALHLETGTSLEFQVEESPGDTSEQVRAWTRELPSLRAIYIALRTYLEVNHLSMVVKGGVGSYTLVVMIVTALKDACNSFDPDDLAGQLLHVLDFWGSANLTSYAYSADPPQRYRKWGVQSTEDVSNLPAELQRQSHGMDYILSRNNDKEPHLLCLQDPTNYRIDLGQKSFRIKEVQTLLKAAHERMFKAIQTSREEKSEVTHTPDDPQRPLLQNLIRADFTAFELARRKFENLTDTKIPPPDKLNHAGALRHEQPARGVENGDSLDDDHTLLSDPEQGLGAFPLQVREAPARVKVRRIGSNFRKCDPGSLEMPDLTELALKKHQAQLEKKEPFLV